MLRNLAGGGGCKSGWHFFRSIFLLQNLEPDAQSTKILEENDADEVMDVDVSCAHWWDGKKEPINESYINISSNFNNKKHLANIFNSKLISHISFYSDMKNHLYMRLFTTRNILANIESLA